MAFSKNSASQNSGKAPSPQKSDFQRGHAEDRQDAASDNRGMKKRKPTRGGKSVQRRKAAQRAWAEESGVPTGPKAQMTRGQGTVKTDVTGKKPVERPTDDEFSSDNEFEDAQSTFGDTDEEEVADSALDGVTKMLDAASLQVQTTASSLQSVSRTGGVPSRRKDTPMTKAERQAPRRTRPKRDLYGKNGDSKHREGSHNSETGCPVSFADHQTFDANGQEWNALRITARGSVNAQNPYRYAPLATQSFNWDNVTEMSIHLMDNQGSSMTIPYSFTPSSLAGSVSTAGTNATSSRETKTAPASWKGFSGHHSTR